MIKAIILDDGSHSKDKVFNDNVSWGVLRWMHLKGDY